MTEQKIYSYFVAYHYAVMDSYETGIANIIIETNCPQIKGKNELESIKKLILSNHYAKGEDNTRPIIPIITNIIPLPIKGK